jgi:hypothetical protein
MAIDKVVASFDEAISDVQDGWAVGGLGSPYDTPRYWMAKLTSKKLSGLAIVGHAPRPALRQPRLSAREWKVLSSSHPKVSGRNAPIRRKLSMSSLIRGRCRSDCAPPASIPAFYPLVERARPFAISPGDKGVACS